LDNRNFDRGYLLGVDTGNSKTHALITDLSGFAIGFGTAGCGNYEVTGVDGFIKTVNEAVSQAIAAADIKKKEIAGMGFGIAGYDWPSEKGIMVQCIDSLGISAPYEFVNDVTIGLIAGSTRGWGVAADAGTGNNVRGRDKNGRIGRITGNSIRFGEIGGAGEMVWQAQVAATYAWTKRGPKTRITRLLLDYTGDENEDILIENLAMEQVHLPPILAVQIVNLATEGDTVAKGIITKSAQELALNVNAVIRQLDLQAMDLEVILIGSTFNAGEIYLTPFRETILAFAPGAKFIQLNVPPVVGSVLLAAEAIDLKTKPLRNNLLNKLLENYSED